jgi:hypothetical protein
MAARPIGNVPYQDLNESGDGFNPYNNTEGYNAGYAAPAKKGISPWIKWGIPIAIIVIVGAVVGGVVGSRSHKNNTNSDISSSNPTGGSNGVTAKNGLIGIFPTGTDTYLLPIYPATVRFSRSNPTHSNI